MTAEPTSQQRLQQHRLRTTLLSVVNFALQTGILSLYAIGGSVAWDVVLAFFLVAVGTSAAFWIVIRTGLNLRLADPGMLTAQIVTSWLVQGLFMVIAPQLTVVFLVCLLVGYIHAMITFEGRQFTVSWLLQGALTAVGLYAGRERFGYPGTSSLDMVVLWLFFFLCTYRLTAIGMQYATLRAKLSQKNRQLSESLERIEELASHDELTGLLNRRSFMTLLEAEQQRFTRTGQMFCVGILDIDHFKRINDTHGHLVGDAVLKAFSRAAGASVRGSDVFARYGGEEFIVLLTAPSTRDAAERALDRIRRAVESHSWEALTPGRAVTLSAGVACSRADESIEQLISRADRALYAAKEAGRNRVVAAQ